MKLLKRIESQPKNYRSDYGFVLQRIALDISDTIYQFYGIKISHETIRNWIMKFTIAINNYVNTLEPRTSEVWHTDEQMVKIRGKWEYSWNIIDEGTRFLLANTITRGRELHDAKQVST